MCAATWNVGGKVPPDDMDLDNWLDIDDPADVYVIGLVHYPFHIFLLSITHFLCNHVAMTSCSIPSSVYSVLLIIF